MVRDLQSITAVVSMLLIESGMEYDIEQFHSAEELLTAYKRNASWDLILLDIMLAGKNGVELAETLRRTGVETDLVFITSSPEYALAGYQAYPVGYLLKPITKEKLGPVLTRCLEQRRKRPLLVLDDLEGGKITLPLKDICYIEVFRRELVIHCKERTFSCMGPLNAVMNELPTEVFYRCHRSFVVNLAYVSGIQKYHFLLQGSREVPIAMRNYAEAQSKWLNYLK